MKKRIAYIVTAILFGTMALFSAGESFARSESIFLSEIEKVADQAIGAWIGEESKSLEAAFERLTLNEAYLMAVGQSSKGRSYLALVPKSLGQNSNAVAAYIYLIRKERGGVRLWPVSFFEGRRFQFDQKGER